MTQTQAPKLCLKCKEHGLMVEFYWNNQDLSKNGKPLPYEVKSKQKHNCPFSDYALSNNHSEQYLKELQERMASTEPLTSGEHAAHNFPTTTHAVAGQIVEVIGILGDPVLSDLWPSVDQKLKEGYALFGNDFRSSVIVYKDSLIVGMVKKQ